jgi:mRNA-degrading endonuclease toxin of MazEF toxin-antitoxin module
MPPFFDTSRPDFPRRGQVFYASLDKDRPVIILSADSLNRFSLDVCIVPLTTVKHDEFSVRVPLKKGDGGLKSDCWAKCDQVTTLEKRFLQFPAKGKLGPAFVEIEKQVRISLGLV